jgi:hypothetical protein
MEAVVANSVVRTVRIGKCIIVFWFLDQLVQVEWG